MRSVWFFTVLIAFIASFSVAASPDDVVEKLGITLTPKGAPTATYLYAVRTGNLLFLAGHVSVDEKGKIVAGKLGQTLNTKQGANAARLAGISILSTLKQQLGSLSKVTKFVKVTGMVNAEDDFTEHSQVINGFSNLMVEVFGEKGQHARSAVGMSSLPANAAVEIEVIVEVEPE